MREAHTGIRPDQVHLSWSAEPSSSFTVAWHTFAEGSPAMVEFRSAAGGDWSGLDAATEPSPGRGFIHHAVIRGLSPADGYEYRVRNGEETGETFRTRTAPAPGPADFSFAFLSDTGLIGRPDGNATGTKQVMDEIITHAPLFVLGGGDYAYGNRDGRFGEMSDAVDAWFRQAQPLIARFPFMAQYGNHEIFLDERFEDWAPRFFHPKGFAGDRSYSFDVGEVHFTGLFVPGPAPPEDELAWLDADLGGARDKGARWLVVFQHEPIFGHGHSHPAKSDVREALTPVFEKHRVDLHLSAHDQNYERTYPLLDAASVPDVRRLSPDRYLRGEGVIYAKVSPGGKMSEKRNDFSRFTVEKQPFMAVREDSAHHYALVKVQAKGTIEVFTYSLAGDGVPGTVLDHFTVTA